MKQKTSVVRLGISALQGGEDVNQQHKRTPFFTAYPPNGG